MGVGKEYVALEPYQTGIRDIAGFSPFPGTLNLRADKDEVVRVLENAESHRLGSFQFEGEEYSGIDIYLAEVEGVEAAVLRMDITDYGPEVVEVVAEQKLRDVLSLEDGEKVDIDIL